MTGRVVWLMNRTVKVSELAAAINETLREYADLAAEDMKESISDAGKAVRKEISATAPKDTGKYRKSWQTKKTYEDSTRLTVTVHSPKQYYLTHLLENGHARRNGGRVSARPHIAPAEEKGEAELMRELERKLGSH